MGYIVSYGIHVLIAVVFFILIPFPILIKGVGSLEPSKLVVLLKIYRRIISVAHVALIISFISGLLMIQNWLSLWTISVFLIWLGLGVLLGFTAKKVRLSLASLGNQQHNEEEIQSLFVFSLLLTLTIIVMFAVKILPYFI
ncbi:hypothetical protein BTS2_3683 [Bacillus sp. TS-2]|nr:hypothetical protein BTS2_3683 [Bacillus sp. TS-2]